MTLVPNETEQALNRQHDVYAAAREEYRKRIAELAAEVERLRATLRDIATGQVTYLPFIQTVARAALGGKDE